MKQFFILLLILPLLANCMEQTGKISDKVLFEELTPSEFRQKIADAPIVYLPLGTIEWHGEHLPLGSDGLQSKGFFELVAKEVGGIVMPMYFLGPDATKIVDGKKLIGMDFYGAKEKGLSEQQNAGSAYWVADSLFVMMVEATLVQLKRAGFKIVVYHGHGPSTSTMQKHAKEWQEKYGLKMLNCWDENSEEGMGIMVDHAAMNETSLVMALRPELVQMENLPADTSIVPVGLLGKDPRIYASPQIGKQIIKGQKERMVAVLKKLLTEL